MPIPNFKLPYFVKYHLFCLSKIFRNASGICGAVQARLAHTLPGLKYDYNELEPHINAEIMQIHHCKHHATYVNNLNVAEEQLEKAKADSRLCSIILF